MNDYIHTFRSTTLTLLLAFFPAWALAQTAGMREGSLYAPHHDREMDFALWYPTTAEAAPYGGNPVFLPDIVARDAVPVPGRHPVIVMSHGLGGHYRALGWLATGLAQHGAIVVAVNHPNSTVFDFDMQAGLEHWTRGQDLTLMLEHLFADPEFGVLMDPEQIAAVGFSYGGWTALSMAGVRGNLEGYIHHCDRGSNQHCEDITRSGSDLRALDKGAWDGDYADKRIRQVVAIDPGLTFGLTAASVAGLNAPTLLLQLGKGADRLDATDISADGSNLAALLPEAPILEIAPAAHFSVLPQCTDMGAAILEEENDDPVCTDPEGADRAAIHAQVLSATVEHLMLH